MSQTKPGKRGERDEKQGLWDHKAQRAQLTGTREHETEDRHPPRQ